jgi:hypothetical protein
MSATNRCKLLGRGVAAAAAVTTAAVPAAAQKMPTTRAMNRSGNKPAKPPLFNGAVAYGNLLFIADKGYHSEGDIKVHTKDVLRQIREELYQGSFGDEPPVRTTIAAAGGIPGNSLVEIDVIAYI